MTCPSWDLGFHGDEGEYSQWFTLCFNKIELKIKSGDGLAPAGIKVRALPEDLGDPMEALPGRQHDHRPMPFLLPLGLTDTRGLV